MYERAKILQAVNEWNHVLNGFVRLDIGPTAPNEAARELGDRAGAGRPAAAGAGAARFTHALAVTQPVRPVGGIVIVYVERRAAATRRRHAA